jgi:hypothetical protein
VPGNGSRVGLRAPRLLALCLTRTAYRVALGCPFFIGAGEAQSHHRLRGERVRTQRGAWKFCRAGRSRCTPGISSGFDLFIDCDLPNRDMQRTAHSLHAFFSHCYVFPLTTSFQARSAAARFCKCASSTLYSVCILAIFLWVIVATYPRRRALRAIFLASASL